MLDFLAAIDPSPNHPWGPQEWAAIVMTLFTIVSAMVICAWRVALYIGGKFELVNVAVGSVAATAARCEVKLDTHMEWATDHAEHCDADRDELKDDRTKHATALTIIETRLNGLAPE